MRFMKVLILHQQLHLVLTINRLMKFRTIRRIKPRLQLCGLMTKHIAIANSVILLKTLFPLQAARPVH